MTAVAADVTASSRSTRPFASSTRRTDSSSSERPPRERPCLFRERRRPHPRRGAGRRANASGPVDPSWGGSTGTPRFVELLTWPATFPRIAGRPESEGDPVNGPDGAVQVLLEPGDAFVFDRRLWRSRSMNRSTRTRELMFLGYTYRWIRPLDEVVADQRSAWFRGLMPFRQ